MVACEKHASLLVHLISNGEKGSIECLSDIVIIHFSTSAILTKNQISRKDLAQCNKTLNGSDLQIFATS